MVLHGRVMPASNATFLGEVGDTRVVYKPVAGERPLWDFPEGTLAGREVASYLVSEALGWDVVPRTFLRDGPHGPGMVQLWQEPDEEVVAVDIVPAGETPPGWRPVFDGVDAEDRAVSLVHEDTAPLRRMAVFDAVVNNADRKGGHVLAMADGHRYGVDHGVSFHVEDKLRTVLWGWHDEPLLDDERAGLARLVDVLDGDLGTALVEHVAPREVAACRRRCTRLLEAGRLPSPSGGWPAIPWPPF
nr:SCO1664 family protein [Nocardioides perillae]